MSAMASEYSYRCTLSPESVETAKQELNEKRESRELGIRTLRDMVAGHVGLKCPLDSAFLLRFLRARKFDCLQAYQMLVKYYTARVVHADILKELIPSKIGHILESGIVCILPIKDRLNRKIVYFRPGRWSPEDFPMIEIVRANLLTFEEAIKDEETQVNGIVAIGNFANMGIRHLTNIDLTYLRINISIIQDSFPMRFKGMHLVNESSMLGCLFAFVKPLLRSKTIQRLTFHGSSLGSLHEVFDKSCLPRELGGDLSFGDELAKDWKRILMEDEAMFEGMREHTIQIA